MCGSRGGSPGLPVPNSLCGRKAALNLCEYAWEPVWRSGSKSRGIITLSYTDYLMYNVNFMRSGSHDDDVELQSWDVG